MPFRPPLTTQPIGSVELDARPVDLNPGFSDVMGAAFRVDNTVGSTVAGMEPRVGVRDPNFNILEAAQEAGVADQFDAFVNTRNQEDFDQRLEGLRRETRDREILDAAGFGGFAASTFAGTFDLPSLIPGGVIAGLGRKANAARVAGATAVSAGVAEGALQATQDLRTTEESLFAIGGAAVLGGALGAAFGRMDPGIARAASRQVEELPTELNNQAKSLSAAAAGNIDPNDILHEPLRLRNEGRFTFMRKFPGGYIADVAEKYGAPGLAVVLEKFAPFAPFTRANPNIRNSLQTSQVGRQVSADLAESPLQYQLNETGNVVSPGGSVEQVSRYRTNAMLNQNIWAVRESFASYMKDGPVGSIGTLVAPMVGRFARLAGKTEKLSFKEFREAVGEAMYARDAHPVKAVRDLAAKLRGEIYEPIRLDMIDAGLFDDLPFTPENSHSYLNRVYKRDVIQRNEMSVIRRMFDEFKKKQKAAQLRLKNAEAKKALSGDAKPTKAEKAAEGSDEHLAGMDDTEIETAVQSALRSIKGLKPGENMIGVARGNPLQARALDIHDDVLLDMGILETDVGILMENYVRGTIPTIEMYRKFGNLTLEPQIKEISDDYMVRRGEEKSAARRNQLEKEERARIADLKGMRDRIMGVYDMPSNPDDIWSRAGEVGKSLSYMQLLGMQVAAALPDLAGIPSRAGLAEFSRGIVEMATNLPSFVGHTREAADLLSAIEFVGNTRARALSELNNTYQNHSMFETAVEGGTAAFSHATGITTWNATFKSIANVMIMSKLLKAADASVKGKATKKQKIALAENGIDPALAARMAAQFEKHGQKGNALWFARAGNWDDDAAFRAGQQAVDRETNIAVITPGQDKPLWLSTRVGGFLGQFKAFGFAANDRIVLSGIQRGDGDVATQFGVLMGLGAAVSILRADMAGKPRKEGNDLVIDAIDRAGPFQIAFEANAIAELGGLGYAGLTGAELPSRFQSRSSALGLLGPTVDAGLTAAEVGRNASGGNLTEKDGARILRLIPTQNTPYAIIFKDDIERGINAAIGVK